MYVCCCLLFLRVGDSGMKGLTFNNGSLGLLLYGRNRRYLHPDVSHVVYSLLGLALELSVLLVPTDVCTQLCYTLYDFLRGVRMIRRWRIRWAGRRKGWVSKSMANRLGKMFEVQRGNFSPGGCFFPLRRKVLAWSLVTRTA